MTRKTWCASLVVCVFVGLTALDAAAWGPRAQRAITGTAIQVIRRTHADAFKTQDTNYEEDVLRGALAGPFLCNDGKPFTSEDEAIAAFDNEIRLLRDVRKFGMGSYFAYRTGALGMLAADLLLPFALDTSATGTVLKRKIEADIDAHLDEYGFVPQQKSLQFIRDAREYVSVRRSYHDENLAMIADDYARGRGYNGLMKEGGEAYFRRAVEAVADTWHTVLQVKGDGGLETTSSPTVVTWYLVNEIRFLLEQKKNFYQATKTYENFVRVNNQPDAYEKIGDYFYAFAGKEGKDRGVREWRIAYDEQGADRRRVGQKLARHYVAVGETYLVAAAKPGAPEDTLPKALNAFTQALEFDQTNDVAADKINETNTAIAERKERRQLNVNILASAEKVMVEAENSRVAGDFGNAIATYNKALGLFEAINNEFKDQEDIAKKSTREVKKSITDIINQVLETASDQIDKGDKSVDSHDFPAARAAYQRVPEIVAVIPGDETTTHGKDKKELIATAEKKLKDTDAAETRWKEKQAQEAAAAKAKAAGAAAGGGAPAAGGAAAAGQGQPARPPGMPTPPRRARE